MSNLLTWAQRVLALLCIAAMAIAFYEHEQEPSQPELPYYPGTEARRPLVVTPQEVTDDALKKLAHSQVAWLHKQMETGGRLPYQIPEGTQDQLPRQWLATLALGQWAIHTGNAKDYNAFIRNLHYRLGTDSAKHDGALYLEHEGDAYLATSALAAEALRKALPSDEAWQRTYQSVLRGIMRLHRGNGVFDMGRGNPATDRNFATPATLMALTHANRLNASQRRDMLADLKAHWKKTRSLYGAPWLLLAFETSASPRTVFAIADALVQCQQTDPTDEQRWGSFSRAECTDASDSPIATAMRAQGLAAARRVALKANDKERAERYEIAYRLAMRQVMQLTPPDGAPPTSPTDDTIRIDAPAHVVAAVLEWVGR